MYVSQKKLTEVMNMNILQARKGENYEKNNT